MELTRMNGDPDVGEDFDLQQEIARSAFADMLHDHERNNKYHAALREAIDEMHSSGNIAVVLDIGTGSGFLAMIAAKHGADVVYACESTIIVGRHKDGMTRLIIEAELIDALGDVCISKPSIALSPKELAFLRTQ